MDHACAGGKPSLGQAWNWLGASHARHGHEPPPRRCTPRRSLPADPGGAPALPPCAAHSFPLLEREMPGQRQGPGLHSTRGPLGMAAGLAVLLPLAALAVAARKGRLRRAQRRGVGPRERVPSGRSLDALLSSQLGPGNSLRLLHTAGWPSVQQACQAPPLGGAAEGTPLLTGSSAGSPDACGTAGWSWGLSTDSLHLMPGELKVRTLVQEGCYSPVPATCIGWLTAGP